MSEGHVVNACIKACFALGCYVWRNNTGAARMPGTGNRPIRFGKKGSSDIIGLTKNGRFIGVECKSGTNDIEPAQEDFRAMVLSKKGIYILARNSAQAVFDMQDEIQREYW